VTKAGGSPHLARLAASPRPTGGAAIAAARAYCAIELHRLGFVVREESFEYSAFAGRFGAPSFGILLPIAATLAVVAANSAAPDVPWFAIGVVLIAIAAAIALARGVLDAPIMRRSGVNIEATRGPSPTRLWLVAHLDSKSQPVPMLVRVAGVVVLALGLIGVAISLLARSSGVAALVVTWIGGVPLMLSVVGQRSAGALDNASGVAAVLGAAEALSPALPIGVLITDAEELSLAGARAWARSQDSGPGVALNCDSVDDEGELTAMFTRRRPIHLLATLAEASAAFHEPLRVRRLLPGILTDSVALADAGWETLTLSRGTLRTLLRIHTSRDNLSSMRGTGIEGAARVLARTAARLV
jgi:peptidase M28-like protein